MSDAANDSGCPTCGVASQARGAAPILSEDIHCIAGLLSTNTPPSDTDATILRSVVQESRLLIDALDAQIIQAETTLANLNALRSATSAEMSKATIVLHPIRSIPHEILGHIFLYCAPELPTSASLSPETNMDTLCPRNYPWNLSHVCRSWRDVALGLPRLWSTICLDLVSYEGLTVRQLIFKARLLFDRAAEQALEVYLFCWKDIDDHPLMAFLEASTTKWSKLTANVSTALFQALSGCSFPLLRDLELDYSEFTFGRHSNVVVHTFQEMQALKRLGVACTDIGDFLYYFRLPYSGITEFHALTIMWDEEFAACLRQMKSITTLTMEILCARLIQPPVVLPSLERLILKECPEGDAGRLLIALDSLSFPSITHLHLDICEHWTLRLPMSHPDLHNLTFLEIENCDSYGECKDEYDGSIKTLLEFFKSLPALKTLWLSDCLISSALVDGLTVTPDFGLPVLLPNLQNMSITDCQLEKCDTLRGKLLTLLESRAPLAKAMDGPDQPFRKLKEVRVEVGDLEVVLDEDETERRDALDGRMSLIFA